MQYVTCYIMSIFVLIRNSATLSWDKDKWSMAETWSQLVFKNLFYEYFTSNGESTFFGVSTFVWILLVVNLDLFLIFKRFCVSINIEFSFNNRKFSRYMTIKQKFTWCNFGYTGDLYNIVIRNNLFLVSRLYLPVRLFASPLSDLTIDGIPCVANILSNLGITLDAFIEWTVSTSG